MVTKILVFGRISGVCQQYVRRMSAVCQPWNGRMSAVYQPYISRMSAVCQPYIRRMSAIPNLPICPIKIWGCHKCYALRGCLAKKLYGNLNPRNGVNFLVDHWWFWFVIRLVLLQHSDKKWQTVNWQTRSAAVKNTWTCSEPELE